MKEQLEFICTIIIGIGMIIVIFKMLNIRLDKLFSYRKTRVLLTECLEKIYELEGKVDVYETQIDVLFNGLKRAKKKAKRLEARQSNLSRGMDEFIKESSINPMIKLMAEVKELMGKGIEIETQKNQNNG